jgi:hypothetical protein
MLFFFSVDGCSFRYWAVNATTFKPDPTVTDSEVNIGFGGLNGPLAYLADVGGVLPLESSRHEAALDVMQGYIDRCIATFDALLAVPQRRQLFDEYGIWTQFDTFRGGCASGPSYGHGYALQAMLMMDRLQDAGHALAFLANITYNNGAGWGQLRSPMYFYEQFVVPPVADMAKLGCGELNVVTVMEPLKVARLILGISDWAVGNVSFIPRVPPQWHAGGSVAVISADNWPVVVATGVVVRVSILYQQSSSGSSLAVTVSEGDVIPLIYARIYTGTAENGTVSWMWRHATNVTRWNVTSSEFA